MISLERSPENPRASSHPIDDFDMPSTLLFVQTTLGHHAGKTYLMTRYSTRFCLSLTVSYVVPISNFQYLFVLPPYIAVELADLLYYINLALRPESCSPVSSRLFHQKPLPFTLPLSLSLHPSLHIRSSSDPTDLWQNIDFAG